MTTIKPNRNQYFTSKDFNRETIDLQKRFNLQSCCSRMDAGLSIGDRMVSDFSENLLTFECCFPKCNCIGLENVTSLAKEDASFSVGIFYLVFYVSKQKDIEKKR